MKVTITYDLKGTPLEDLPEEEVIYLITYGFLTLGTHGSADTSPFYSKDAPYLENPKKVKIEKENETEYDDYDSNYVSCGF